MTSSSIPTRGELERRLEQRVRTLYREQLGQKLHRVICQFFDAKLTIVLEGTTTPSERLLLGQDQGDFVSQLREKLDGAIEPQVKDLIESILGVNILTLLYASKPESGFSSITAVLNQAPSVRDPESIPKSMR